jgi:uncharacterized protein (DUF1501 family)
VDASVSKSEPPVLVFVFLRGGYDALNFVLPISGEDRAIYESERPTLKIPLTGDKAAIALDGRFGLHPSAKPLIDLYKSKKLAFIHASGLTSNTRSHFDAQTYVDLGTPDKKDTITGWLSRYLMADSRMISSQQTKLEAVSVGVLLPTSLLGFPDAVVFSSPNGFNLNGGKFQTDQRSALRRLYSENKWLGSFGLQTLDAIDLLETAQFRDYKPQNGADYSKGGDLGNRLRTLAETIRMGLGVRAAAIDMQSWDTHQGQGNGPDGQFANLVSTLSQALLAFYTDLNGQPSTSSSKVTVVVMSEFGRRLKENANHGTDHGHGSLIMVLGDAINGGKVHGNWPGLKTENLYERADLAVTTDFRDVLCEVLKHGFGNPPVDQVFPDFRHRPMGLGQA